MSTNHDRVEILAKRVRVLAAGMRGGSQRAELHGIMEELLELARAGASVREPAKGDTQDMPVNYGVIPHPRLKRDYKGKAVRTLTEMSNGWGTIPAGKIAHITGQGPKGSILTIEACPCCGLKAHMSGIQPEHIVFVEASA